MSGLSAIEPTQLTIADATHPLLAECLAAVPLHVRGEIIPGQLNVISVPSDVSEENRRALSHAFDQLAHHEKADISRIDLGNNISARVSLKNVDMCALTKVVLGGTISTMARIAF